MQKPKRYLVTSALPYANGPLHVGHLAGAYLSGDIYVRYLRMQGEDVKYICGSDEHGAAITVRAKKEGTTPQEIVDRYHPLIKDSFDKIGMSFDIYHRTSTALHHETSAAFFKTLEEKGVFNVKTSEQYYDATFDQFLADRYIKGQCPKCANPNAYGDQCESCGSDLSPTELINPISTLSGETPILKETKHWYLPMQDFQDWVEGWLEGQQGKEKWKKHVIGQCNSWVKQGLQERSMTRDLDWGVKVPLEGAEGKVLYVWLDAPIGYISATKALTEDWKSYWQDEDSKLVHFIGKDNIVFHSIIFPILLHAHGDYILPANVPANQFMNLEGDKISTSRNHAVWLHEYLEDFKDVVGHQDVLRYVLTMLMPENKDSDFNWQEFKDRNDKELVGLLGGFLHRTLTLIHKNYDGKLPKVDASQFSSLAAQFDEVQDDFDKFPQEFHGFIHNYEFRNALTCMMDLARSGNKFLNDTAPWKLIKDDKAAAAAVLDKCLEIVVTLAVYMESFMPFTAKKIQTALQLDEALIAKILKADYDFEMPVLEEPKHFFSRLEDKIIQAQIDKLTQPKAEEKPADKEYKPLKPEITFDDFMKLDIRTATIIAAEKVKKSSKLLQLKVDLGFEQRTVVSGIAKHYEPQELIGQKVLLLANLAPKPIAKIESNGMILMADGEKLAFTSASDAENGSQVS
jgi:methionyl-tRNA synthetase